MSSKDQEILRLQAELARLQAEVASLQEENVVLQQKRSVLSQKGLEKDRKIVEMDKKIESMQATIDSLQNMMAWFRKNYLFCRNYDDAVRAAIVYSLFSSCKAHDVDIRSWLEDTLKRIPTEKDIDQLLPCNWQALPANSK